MRPGRNARSERIERAKKRAETAVVRTPAQRLAELDQRLAELDQKLGKGNGAGRERARLARKA